VIPLLKKGDSTNCGKYGEIRLLYIVYGIYAEIMKRNILGVHAKHVTHAILVFSLSGD
jgi:hypothetical protein